MSNNAALDDLVQGYREERREIQVSIDNLVAGKTFIGTSSDPFGASDKEAHLADLRRQVSELDGIIVGHEARNA